MKSGRSYVKFLLINLIFLLTFASCSAKTPQQQKKLGADSDYFQGLTLLRQNNQKDAIAKFTRCFKKGTYYCARASAMELCKFGSLQEKNNACIKMLQKFTDSETLLIACTQFMEANEIGKIVEYTGNLDFATENNKLIRLRLEALDKQHNSSYESEVFKWYTTCKISNEHYQFYRDFYHHPDFELSDAEELIFTPEQFAINYRIEAYKRNYTYTFANAEKILSYFDSGELPHCQQLASDLGKAYLYGSSSFSKNAQFMQTLASKYANTSMEYYFWYYCGRLYEKTGINFPMAIKNFKKAAQTAQTPEQKDDALWYIMNITLSSSSSIKGTLSTIKECGLQWSNPEEFDGFFEKLLSSMLVSGQWTSLYDFYTALDGLASNEIIAQYAYIYGRLVEEGMILEENTGRPAQEDSKNAFQRALNADSNVYYKIMAANKLNLPENQITDLLCKTNYIEPKILDKAAENLITGCILFGFPEKIYPVWKELSDKKADDAEVYTGGLSAQTAFWAADFLRKCSTGNDDYFQQSLRIASRTAATAERPLKKEELKLLYPQNYLETVQNCCQKYNVKESAMFALIRSESFFDPDVTSSAGAVGLTQLMELTSGDIARRLKYEDYSLEDPETNIEFGTYYLSELIRRTDGSYLQAFFSYNAGITRVRKWLKSSIVEFGIKKEMPLDLFLESLPYSETREYGRKLVSAGVMYQWLYGNDANAENAAKNAVSCQPFAEIVNYFVN